MPIPWRRPAEDQMERFRKTLRGTVISSDGYSVRISGRTMLLYKDSAGDLRINCEVLGPRMGAVVYISSIPDTPQRPRKRVLNDLSRAFTFAGWTLDQYPPAEGDSD